MDEQTRVAFVSLGCPKNTVDSEKMLGLLAEAGCAITADEADADVMVINTCGFLEAARVEADEVIREAIAQKLSGQGRLKRVVVAGCLVQRDQQALAGMKHYQDWDSGYSKQQSTRPQTLGYGLVDSPAGQAAWILEKFWAWTDCNGHPENALSRDEMLDNIMLYWLNGSGASSGRLYWESFGSFSGGDVEAPTGCSIFPKEIFRCSRRWAEQRYKNIIYWNDLEQGGHFAAFEQPEVFVGELRNCFRQVR